MFLHSLSTYFFTSKFSASILLLFLFSLLTLFTLYELCANCDTTIPSSYVILQALILTDISYRFELAFKKYYGVINCFGSDGFLSGGEDHFTQAGEPKI